MSLKLLDSFERCKKLAPSDLGARENLIRMALQRQQLEVVGRFLRMTFDELKILPYQQDLILNAPGLSPQVISQVLEKLETLISMVYASHPDPTAAESLAESILARVNNLQGVSALNKVLRVNAHYPEEVNASIQVVLEGQDIGRSTLNLLRNQFGPIGLENALSAEVWPFAPDRVFKTEEVLFQSTVPPSKIGVSQRFISTLRVCGGIDFSRNNNVQAIDLESFSARNGLLLLMPNSSSNFVWGFSYQQDENGNRFNYAIHEETQKT